MRAVLITQSKAPPGPRAKVEQPLPYLNFPRSIFEAPTECFRPAFPKPNAFIKASRATFHFPLLAFPRVSSRQGANFAPILITLGSEAAGSRGFEARLRPLEALQEVETP